MYLYALINMRRLKVILILFAMITAGLVSCEQGVIYNDYRSIEGANWHRDSVYHYEVVVDDSLSLYNLFINIRNNTEYPYSNIYLFITTEFPNGHSTRDTIECLLADKNGRWLGSGSGSIKDNKIMLQQALRFPLIGSYHIYLEQAMRIEPLPGIEDIGFSIEDYKP
jgi:gliding motility-associated lipoprotein GldH